MIVFVTIFPILMFVLYVSYINNSINSKDHLFIRYALLLSMYGTGIGIGTLIMLTINADVDYYITLDHNNVIIDTKHHKHIVIPADSSLQLWIEQDNL